MSLQFHKPYGGRKVTFLNTWAKLKHGMTAETYNELVKADRKPREGTREGRKYDERRAVAYMEQITGEVFASAVWDKSNRAVQFVIRHHDKQRLEIPNWDAGIIEADLNDLIARTIAA